MKAAMIPSSNTHGALSPDLMQGCRRQALAIGGQPLQQACWRGRRAQRGAKSGEGRGDSCGIFLASLQQKGIGALNFYALTGELADAEVSDVLGDEADDLGAGLEVTGQDRRCAGGDVDVLGRAHRRRHAGELSLDLLRRDLCLRQGCPHKSFVPARRLGIGLAAGVQERPAQLVQDQRAPVKADQSLVVEVDQQATGGCAEQGVGVGNDRDHGSQPAKISLSRSAPS